MAAPPETTPLIARRAGRRSPSTSDRSGSSVATLPSDLLEAGASRLMQVGLLVAGVGIVFFVLDLLVPPPPASAASAVLARVANLVGIAMSLTIALIAGKRWLPARALLDLGLVYEVLQALTIAINFHSVSLSTATASRGWSAVAVWVLSFPLVIPSTRGKVLLATLTAALMEPVGLLVNIAAGAPAPRAGTIAQAFTPTAVAACLAIVVSRILYRLQVDASQLREMRSYRLVERLGEGGMGEVWRAEHRMLARPAAIKLIRSHGNGGSDELVRRFAREARATATLRSPHTVQIYDYGTTDDGTFYYVMELLEGYDLDSLVREFGPVPPERAIHLLRQACLSLEEAHQGGLVHRDIKPANLYACRYGIEYDFVKVLDFGLVKAAHAPGGRETTLTSVGLIAGTPAYMSPEMARGGGDVDFRSDLYALGCVGYYLVTGRPVFDRETSVEILIDHVRTPPEPPSRTAPGPLPPGLEEILLSCLQKDPGNRPQSAEEISGRLAEVARANPWTAERARQWWLANAPAPGRRPSAAQEETIPSAPPPRDLAPAG